MSDIDLQTATPVEFDTRLAEVYVDGSKINQRLNWAIDTVMRAGGAKQTYNSHRPWTLTLVEAIDKVAEIIADEATTVWVKRDAEKALATFNEVKAEHSVNLDIQREMGKIFRDRGGWTRAHLAITNGGGHVHSSMDCHSCFYTGFDGKGNWRDGTQFQWLPQLSGHAEEEIIEKAGERACTVCYPNAPVNVLSRPTQIFSKDEERKAADRIEREAKRQERIAAEITVPAYFDYSDTAHPKTFKSTRAVTNAIAGALSSLCWYGQEHPTSGHWQSDIKVLKGALEAKGIDYDYDKALAAARKKVIREGGQPKY